MILIKKYSKYLFVAIIIGLSTNAIAQSNDSTSTTNWDNQLYLGNRYVWSNDNWRYMAEFQIRLENDIRSLQQYYFEGAATYMPNENWEIVPDFRYTIHTDRTEFRPGLGAIYKMLWTKKQVNQLAHQFKWQADIENNGEFKHGVRYILFYNRALIKKKLGLTSGAGFFYRWSNSFNGVRFARGFMGLAYSFNDIHTLSINYFVGAENRATHWEYIGGLFATFVINLDNDSKYVPAKYISF